GYTHRICRRPHENRGAHASLLTSQRNKRGAHGGKLCRRFSSLVSKEKDEPASWRQLASGRASLDHKSPRFQVKAHFRCSPPDSRNCKGECLIRGVRNQGGRI